MLHNKNKDLNLLSILVVIGDELNLSRASERLGLSQPALSHALSRLREQFSDPLFVRGQRGLLATPKVSTLLPQVREVLARAESLYGSESPLDLAKIDRRVVIACTTYFESRIVATLIKLVSEKAPGVRLETVSLSGGFPKRELESGDLDLAIAAYFEELPNGFRIKTVFKDHFVCVCSKRNPYLKTPGTIESFLAARHIQIEIPPGVFAPVDRYLRDKKKSRTIVLRIGNFLTPARILHESDFLLTCPLSLAKNYEEMYPLAVTELPFGIPGIDTKMVWHEKNQHDLFHRWLRESVARA
jgi:DNA-binding transcriptional LysR family regulator